MPVTQDWGIALATKLWLHSLPAEVERLEDEIRNFISGVPELRPQDRTSLLDDARFQIHQTASLVLTGQYSSGKSTLIQALTDGGAQVVVDADISTDDVSEHRWGDVLLVDTPGVKAGVERHDELAERALSTADLVLFTVTGHGFDDALVRHAVHVADELGKLDQMIVVWTQRGKFIPEPDVQRDHLRTALGPRADRVPMLSTDAQWYLDAIADPGGRLSARKKQESGIDALRDAMNEISASRGDLARYRQPLQNMLVVLASVESRLFEDENEGVALDMLTRQEKAVLRQQETLATALADARRQFEDDCLRLAGVCADGLDTIDASVTDPALAAAEFAESEADLRTGLDAAAQRYGQRLNDEVLRSRRSLTSDLEDIDHGPQARRLGDMGVLDVETATTKPRRTPFARLRQPAAPPAWANDLAAHMDRVKAFWGAGDGVWASRGSTGHKIVLDVGHLFDHKFKPFQAVRIANNIGKVMKVAGPALVVGATAYSVFAEERNEMKAEAARQSRRSLLRESIRGQAGSIADRAEAEVRRVVGGAFENSLDEIEQTRAGILKGQQSRSAAQQRIGALRERIAATMTAIAPTPTD